MREVPPTKKRLEGLTRYAEPAEAMVRGNEVTLFLPPTGMSTENLTGKSLPVKLPGVFPVGMGNPPRTVQLINAPRSAYGARLQHMQYVLSTLRNVPQ